MRPWVCALAMLVAGCASDRVVVGSSSTSESSGQGTSTGDGDGDGDGSPDCGSVSIAPELTPAMAMLVVDASRSMAAQTWDHDQDPATPGVSRWHAARELIDTIALVAGDRMLLGVRLFPAADACAGSNDCLSPAACSIAATSELPPSEDALLELSSVLPDADATTQTLGGGSPAVAALRAAYEELSLGPPGLPKGVVFITDGLGNCAQDLPFPTSLSSYDASVVAVVDEAFQQHGIVTAIVGVDVEGGAAQAGLDAVLDHDVIASLNALAWAGGVPREGGNNPDGRQFFTSAESAEIAMFLDPVCTLSECVLDLSMTEAGPPAPEQLELITVEYVIEGGEPVALPQLDEPACMSESGWTWLLEGEIMTMCGSACELFKDGGASFTVHYGCPLPKGA